MGTEISLDIAGLSVDWSKNCRGVDHGFLFQSDERRRVPWAADDDDNDDPDRLLMEMAFTRPLRTVLPRLELLGHTLATAKVDYERVAAVCVEDRRSLREAGIDVELPLELMTFGEFREFVTRDAITDLDDSFSSEPVRKLLSGPDSGICDVAGEYIGIRQVHSTSVRLLSKRSLRRRYFARAARIGTAQ